ncbi:MAG: lytic transglycosylase domain-containing protein [Deltaproteobacteria bacterium]|nr:MAG: lytic transglycosylase domain-containing protein [Deltaproteobacteria bacterium]
MLAQVRAFMRLALCSSLLLVVAAGPALAVSKAERHVPSRSQLRRLYYLEPYIRYFSSLSYGPEGARVPADYIRALILTESAGDTWARSVKGARGLTQILPSTARAALAELGASGYDYLYIDEKVFKEFSPDDLYDPALNILIACYLSATYHARYEGRTELVVAAWNAGPGAVARYGNEPPPYRETRDLISRVKGYMSYLGASEVY